MAGRRETKGRQMWQDSERKKSEDGTPAWLTQSQCLGQSLLSRAGQGPIPGCPRARGGRVRPPGFHSGMKEIHPLWF